jgi:hypothetical protein
VCSFQFAVPGTSAEMDKLLDENDSDLEIVFDDEEQSEILQFQQKANWADSEFEIISGITIEVNAYNERFNRYLILSLLDLII